MTVSSFLRLQDPVPYRLWPARLLSPFVLVSDHAGRATPEKLGTMGLSSEEWQRHIAYDIGIREVGYSLRERLGCALIEQVYSRLVIDCNRAAGHTTSIPAVSDGTPIPANQDLSDEARREREKEISHVYHEQIGHLLDEHSDRDTVFISLHSFTPHMRGPKAQKRPWHVGLLHDHDPESARIMQKLLREEDGLCVGDNEPYVLNPTNEYTVPHHAASRRMPALEIEIRQDLIADTAGQHEWAERLARVLPRFWAKRKGEKE